MHFVARVCFLLPTLVFAALVSVFAFCCSLLLFADFRSRLLLFLVFRCS